ncbi:MAG: hypothetical protein AB7O43_05220 [Hyphomicrobiaceae bacterium]
MTARVGLIIPSSNRIVEDEMAHHYPQGVSVHITRMRMTGIHKKPLAETTDRIADAAGALADARCEAITFHCTANSTDAGPEGERMILEAMTRGGARRASSTATAIRRALAALQARNVVLVTPYTQAATDHEAEYLENIGARVLTAKGHDLGTADDYLAAPTSFWVEQTLAARHPEADVYFVSCAAIRAFGAVEELEQTLARPVITSNQAVIWDQLHSLGFDGSNACPSRLMACR